MKSVIFIAPPAAGKGTQSSILMEQYGYIHISTGDMLREEISNNTSLGVKANEIMAKGGLVDDEIIIGMVENKLNSVKGKPFILDGFPRTLNQAKALDSLLAKLNIDDVKVIYIDLDLETALKRTLGRVTCTKCGASFNLNNPDCMPKVKGICDNCQGELVVRDDDNEESFRNRFETFINNTKPIVDYYKEHDNLAIIEPNNDKMVVATMIKDILNCE